MSQPNVVSRVNSMVQSMERPYVDLTGGQLSTGKQKKKTITTTTTTTTTITQQQKTEKRSDYRILKK